MNIVFLLIGLLIGLVMTGIVYYLLHKQNMELKKEVEEVISLRSSNQLLQSRMDDMQREMLEYKNKDEEKNKEIQNNIRIIAQYKTQQEALTEKLDNQKNEILNLREELNKEFKLLANEILEEKSKKFSALNEEKISTILNPLKEKLQNFEKKVEETYNNETREKASLRKELEQIININRQMSEDAQKLTSALKGDSKTQGDWGEFQLELLLEKTGLQKGTHYMPQPNYKSEEGTNLRPDYIINLPEGKNFIIDSKVSLTAYERYFNAESEAEKASYLKEHLNSIHQHINDLGSKNYPGLYAINSPDFVFMFIEPKSFIC